MLSQNNDHATWQSLSLRWCPIGTMQLIIAFATRNTNLNLRRHSRVHYITPSIYSGCRFLGRREHSDRHNPGGGREATASAAAFDQQSTPVPLPFDPKSLMGISEKLIQTHWENNYTVAVKALNTLRGRLPQALSDPNTPPYVYTGLKREQLLRTGSIVLHEYYFGNLGGNGKPGADMRTHIAGSFGTYDAWESEFRKIGAGLGGGSGWVVLGYNRKLKLGFENYWMADRRDSSCGHYTGSGSWTCTNMFDCRRWTTAPPRPSTSMPFS